MTSEQTDSDLNSSKQITTAADDHHDKTISPTCTSTSTSTSTSTATSTPTSTTCTASFNFTSANRQHITSSANNDHDKQIDNDSRSKAQSKLVEGAKFKIRTLNRHHLDFDPQYDLNDVNNPNRSHWSGPFHFVQAADSQFGMIDSYKYRRSEPGWSEEMQLCRDLLTRCSQMKPKPKFLIICGDLVDAWPATKLRRQQLIDFKQVFSQLDPDIPLVCVCGNHDVGDKPTIDSIREYNQDFGDDYFHFTLNDCLFIVINSQFYQNRQFVNDLAEQQDKWLESLLEKCHLFKYSFIFEHIPWFLQDPLEEDDYFNIRLEVRGKWLDKFHKAGITKILCGHYHRNAGGWYNKMEQVVTSAIGAQMGNDQSGCRIVRVLDNTVDHHYYAMQDLPDQIDLS